MGPVKAAAFRTGFEGFAQPDHRFRRTQHQEPVRLRYPGEAVEDVDLGILVEIDQHVAAEHHIENSELGKIVQQIEVPVLDHGANLGVDLPELSGPPEVLDQHLDWQATLHLELAVDSGPGFFQNLPGKIGGDDFNPPAGKSRAHLSQAHRQ